METPRTNTDYVERIKFSKEIDIIVQLNNQKTQNLKA